MKPGHHGDGPAALEERFNNVLLDSGIARRGYAVMTDHHCGVVAVAALARPHRPLTLTIAEHRPTRTLPLRSLTAGKRRPYKRRG